MYIYVLTSVYEILNMYLPIKETATQVS